jgi:uncharacterized protein (TIGR02271 family)
MSATAASSVPAWDAAASGHAAGLQFDADADAGMQRRVLPIIEEVVSVQKHWVDKGGYRLSKQVETLEQTVDEVLRTSDVRIERVAIGRTLPEGEVPGVRQEGDTLVVPVIEEILVTEKRLVLREEIRVTRVEGTVRSPQTVSLRKENILIERLGERSHAAAEPLSQTASQAVNNVPEGDIQRSER